MASGLPSVSNCLAGDCCEPLPNDTALADERDPDPDEPADAVEDADDVPLAAVVPTAPLSLVPGASALCRKSIPLPVGEAGECKAGTGSAEAMAEPDARRPCPLNAWACKTLDWAAVAEEQEDDDDEEDGDGDTSTGSSASDLLVAREGGQSSLSRLPLSAPETHAADADTVVADAGPA